MFACAHAFGDTSADVCIFICNTFSDSKYTIYTIENPFTQAHFAIEMCLNICVTLFNMQTQWNLWAPSFLTLPVANMICVKCSRTAHVCTEQMHYQYKIKFVKYISHYRSCHPSMRYVIAYRVQPFNPSKPPPQNFPYPNCMRFENAFKAHRNSVTPKAQII